MTNFYSTLFSREQKRRKLSLIAAIFVVVLVTLFSTQSSFAQDQTEDVPFESWQDNSSADDNEPIPPGPIVSAPVEACTTSWNANIGNLAAGTIVTNAFPGVTITTDDPATPPMIFDSANPTGGDKDLGTPNQAFGGTGVGSGGASGPGTNDTALGKVLIISEDGDQSDPDDDGTGGVLTFTFDSPQSVNYIDILDIDESAVPTINLYDSNGNLIYSRQSDAYGENSYQRLPLESGNNGQVDNVAVLEVDFPVSGAIPAIGLCTIEEPAPVTCSGHLTDLILIDPATGQELMIHDGSTISNTFADYQVVAETSGEVGSVRFQYATPSVNGSRTENLEPYDMFGSNMSEELVDGDYSITVYTYSEIKGNGELCSQDKIEFTVVTPAPATCNGAIDSFTLVNSDTNEDVMTLTDGVVVPNNFANYSIRANTSGAVESVEFIYNFAGNTGSKVESVAPYATFGDATGNYAGKALVDGSYTVSASAFSEDSARGALCASDQISFVVGSEPTPPTGQCSTSWNANIGNLAAGTIVTTAFPGVTITTDNVNNPPMIFDTSNPTGGDSDLGTPNQAFGGPGVGSGGASGAGVNQTALGNVIIISEDGDQSDPDDNASGGVLTFSFDNPQSINFIDILDIDESSIPTINLYDASGNLIYSRQAVAYGDNSYQRLSLDSGNGQVDNVSVVEVDFPVSGAIASIGLCDGEVTTPSPSCGDYNLLENPSFEFGTSSSIDGWETHNGAILRQTDYAVHGSFNGYVSNTGFSNSSFIFQDVYNIVPGSVLDLTFYAGVNSPGANHRVYWDYYNASGDRIGTSSAVQIDEDVDVTNALRQYTLQETAPADTAYVRVVGGSSGGLLYLDDMCFHATEPVVLLGTLGDRVWKDANNNGIQDSGEAGVPNVEVELFDDSNNLLDDTVTDSDGFYLFDDLPEGNYVVKFEDMTPMDMPFTSQDSGDDAADSDADSTSGYTDVIPLGPGEDRRDVDAGIIDASSLLGSIGDLVWKDTNRNGLQNMQSENGYPGIGVDLIDADTGNVLESTETDANGKYLFDELPAGNYIVRFEDVSDMGMPFTTKDALHHGSNNDDIESDANPNGETDVITLGTGEHLRNVDAGIIDQIDLEVSKTVSPTTANVGDTVTWTIKVRNQGPGVATGVVLGDAVPSCVDVTNVSVDQGSFSDSTWTIGTLTVSQLVTMTVTSTLNQAGQCINVAEIVDADQPDIDSTPGNDDGDQSEDDEDKAIVGGNDLIDLELTKTVNATSVDAGSPVAWTITVTNKGPSVATGVVVGDSLPSCLELVDATSFDIGTLNVDESKTITINTLVTQPGVCENVAQVIAADQPDVDSNPNNNDGDESEDDEDNASLTAMSIVASLGDLVWLDENADGVKDPTEQGVSGVKVDLYYGNNNYVTSTTTDANGNYLFTNLDPRNYYVRFQMPTGYEISPRDAGSDDTKDSDPDPVNGRTATTALDPSENDPTWDAGIYLPASIGDVVFKDVNKNGFQDSNGDYGVEDVTVILYTDDDGDGTPDTIVASTKTDDKGYYLFDGLVPADNYIVEFKDLPDGCALFTTPDVDGDSKDTYDSDADPTTGYTAPISVGSGEHNDTIDAGIIEEPASLGDRVWKDENSNGVQDDGEPGVDGVTVTLTADTTGDGSADATIGSVITDANGNYEFTDLDTAYTYYLTFTDLPEDCKEFTTPNVGNDETSDSDVNPADGSTGAINLEPGENNELIDAGLLPEKASLGDFVWKDEDSDGIQDASEPGVENVTVNLLQDTTGDGTPDAVVSTIATDVTGFYEFIDLTPGVAYAVQFTDLPEDCDVFTTPEAIGDDTKDSNVDPTTGITAPVTLQPGENNPTLDAGLVPQVGSIGDTIWSDPDDDGNNVIDGDDEPLEDVTVTLQDSNGNTVATTMTDENGMYLFEDLPFGDYTVVVDTTTLPAENDPTPAYDPDGGDDSQSTTTIDAMTPDDLDQDFAYPIKLASLGDYVWKDVNKNGVQDAGEAVVPGVTAILFEDTTGDGNPDQSVANTTTDNAGFYEFLDLTPGVAYLVQFTNLPADCKEFTAQDMGGNDATDSDVDPATGKTAPVVLTPGEHNPDLDAGLVTSEVKIGAYVFVDSNANGNQDGGETGVPGITVNLYEDADGDGNPDSTTPIDSMITDAGGNYEFVVDPGVYVIEFVSDDLTTQDTGATDGSDSDPSPTTGFTGPIDVTDGNDDLTVDAGIVEEVKIGDLVFSDLNNNGIQDPSELGVDGIVVNLYEDADGDGVPDSTTPIDSTTTDIGGNYEFSVDPGLYIVEFIADHLADPNMGGNDGTDSDADPSTGLTGTIDVTDGNDDPTIDAGIGPEPTSVALSGGGAGLPLSWIIVGALAVLAILLGGVFASRRNQGSTYA